jgi:hypothetical protein
MSGWPSFSAISATAAPSVGRSGFRGVLNRGGQLTEECGNVIVVTGSPIPDRVEGHAEFAGDCRGGHASSLVKLAGQSDRGGGESALAVGHRE